MSEGKEKRSHARAPGKTTVSLSLSQTDLDLITRAAVADGRNRSEFLRYYGRQLALQILDEQGEHTVIPRRVVVR